MYHLKSVGKALMVTSKGCAEVRSGMAGLGCSAAPEYLPVFQRPKPLH